MQETYSKLEADRFMTFLAYTRLILAVAAVIVLIANVVTPGASEAVTAAFGLGTGTAVAGLKFAGVITF